MLDRLDQAGIGEPVRSKLAAIEGITAGAISIALELGDVRDEAPAGVAVKAIREHVSQAIEKQREDEQRSREYVRQAHDQRRELVRKCREQYRADPQTIDSAIEQLNGKLDGLLRVKVRDLVAVRVPNGHGPYTDWQRTEAMLLDKTLPPSIQETVWNADPHRHTTTKVLYYWAHLAEQKEQRERAEQQKLMEQHHADQRAKHEAAETQQRAERGRKYEERQWYKALTDQQIEGYKAQLAECDDLAEQWRVRLPDIPCDDVALACEIMQRFYPGREGAA